MWEIDGGGKEIFSGTMGGNLASLCFLLCVELHGPALPLPGTDPEPLCLRQGSDTAATAGRGWRGSSRTDVDVGGSDWPRTGSASSRCFKNCIVDITCMCACLCDRHGEKVGTERARVHASARLIKGLIDRCVPECK